MRMFKFLAVLFILSACESPSKSVPARQTGHYAYDDPTSLQPTIWEAPDVDSAQSVVLPVEVTPSSATQKVCRPHYTLTLETRMHSISLDPLKHIRNKMNANVFTIPVDEVTYNSSKVGSVLDSNFDSMGFAMKGSWQSVKTVVVSKHKTCD